MGGKLLSLVVAEMIKAKYFSVIVDSAPDVSHVDQLTLILRYTSTDGRPVERFVRFIELHGHGAKNLTSVIMKYRTGHE